MRVIHTAVVLMLVALNLGLIFRIRQQEVLIGRIMSTAHAEAQQAADWHAQSDACQAVTQHWEDVEQQCTRQRDGFRAAAEKLDGLVNRWERLGRECVGNLAEQRKSGVASAR